MTDIDLPPETQDPSGRTPESLPKTAPNPSRADPEADPTDGSTELPPTPAA